jgi:hypothetical protein
MFLNFVFLIILAKLSGKSSFEGIDHKSLAKIIFSKVENLLFIIFSISLKEILFFDFFQSFIVFFNFKLFSVNNTIILSFIFSCLLVLNSVYLYLDNIDKSNIFNKLLSLFAQIVKLLFLKFLKILAAKYSKVLLELSK